MARTLDEEAPFAAARTDAALEAVAGRLID